MKGKLSAGSLRSITGALPLVCLVLIAARSESAVIFADTDGSDNFTTAQFYGVQFVSGSGAIQSVTYDVSADSDAFFDFDGSTSYASAALPVLGTLVGLAASDVTFTLLAPFRTATNHPTRLQVNFTPNSFQAGDSLRFAADTDFFVSDPAPGGVFGTAGAPISVMLYGGGSNSANFVKTSASHSEVTMNVVPEASGQALAAIAMIAFFWQKAASRRLRFGRERGDRELVCSS